MEEQRYTFQTIPTASEYAVASRGPVSTKWPVLVYLKQEEKTICVQAQASWRVFELQAHLNSVLALKEESVLAFKGGQRGLGEGHSQRPISDLFSPYCTFCLIPPRQDGLLLGGSSSVIRMQDSECEMSKSQSNRQSLLHPSGTQHQTDTDVDIQIAAAYERVRSVSDHPLDIHSDYSGGRTEVIKRLARQRRLIGMKSIQIDQAMLDAEKLAFKTRWHWKISSDDHREVEKRLDKIQAYENLTPQVKEHICALFNQEAIEKIKCINVERGYDLGDMRDCFNALNAMPNREKRNLLKRIKDRIHYIYTTSDTTTAFNQKIQYGDIFKPEFNLPTFQDKYADRQILKYSFIGKHFEHGIKTQYDEREVISKVVEEFCPNNLDSAETEIEDPVRIVKLLEILDVKEALQLVLYLPHDTLSGVHMTERSSLKPFVIDFINDVREDQRMTDLEIFNLILYDGGRQDEQKEDLLVMELERLKAIDQDQQHSLAKWFKLTEIQEVEKKIALTTDESRKLSQKTNRVRSQQILLSNTDLELEHNETKQREKMRADRLSELEDQIKEQARTIDVKTYGKFLQAIPRPGDKVRFLTIQGQPALHNSALAGKEGTTEVTPAIKYHMKVSTQVTEYQHRELAEEKQIVEQLEERAGKSDIYNAQKIRSAMEQPKDAKGQYFNEMKIEQQELCWINHHPGGGEGKALLSYWQYQSKIRDFECSFSQVVFQPIPFKDMNYFTGKTCQRTFLYRGNNDEIFWFSFDDKNQLNIFILASDDQRHPEPKLVSHDSFLYRHIKIGNYVQSGDKSFENPVPNLITDSSKRKLCVFTYTNQRSAAPVVYFYDIESGMEIAKASGASIFLNTIPSAGTAEKKLDKLYFYCDFNLAHCHRFDENFKHNLQYQLEKYESQLKDSPRARATWFDCEVDFDAIRREVRGKELPVEADLEIYDDIQKTDKHQQAENDAKCHELIKESDLSKIYEIKTEVAHEKINLTEKQNWQVKPQPVELWDDLDDDVKAKSRFKPIRDDKRQWDAWDSALIQVMPVQNEDGLFAVALVKHSFDLNHRDIRVIVAQSETEIHMLYPSEQKQEFFVVENNSKLIADSIVKIQSQPDGSKKIRAFMQQPQLHNKGDLASIQMKNDDPVQFQKPMRSKNKLMLASINENDGTLTWHATHFPRDNETLGDLKNDKPRSRHISNQLQYWIDFPLICHLENDNINNELIITNLSTKQLDKRTFSFDKIHFVAYLGMNRLQAESRIAFLGKNYLNGELCVVLIRYDKQLENTKKTPDLNKYSIQKFNLGPFLGLKDRINELQKAYLVQLDSQDSRLRSWAVQPAILFVTHDSIYFTDKDKFHDVRAASVGVKSENELMNIPVLRGYNNRFFYVEKSSETYFLCELVIKFRAKEKQWNQRTSTIFSSAYGKILALELDRNYPRKTDSFWNHGGRLDAGKDVKNQLYIIDSQQNLLKLRQADVQYEIMQKVNLSHIPGLQPELEWLNTTDQPKVSISDRNLTIRGTHFIYETGHSAKINLYDKDSKDWRVLGSQSVQLTNWQLHEAVKYENGLMKQKIILQEHPSSRKCCFMGQRGQRDVLLCGFISENKLLLKMRTDRNEEHYWTVMDNSGCVCNMPRTLRRALQSDDWTQMKTKQIIYAQTQLLLQSREQVAAFRFNDMGVLLKTVIFEATHPEVNLIATTFECNYSGELYLLGIISTVGKKQWRANDALNSAEDDDGNKLVKCFEKPLEYRFDNERPLKCVKCKRNINLDAQEKGFMRSEVNVDYNVCGRSKCLPFMVEEDAPRGEIHMKSEDTCDLNEDIIFYSTQARRNTVLSSIYLDPKPSKRSDKDELTQLVICGDYLCWKLPNEPKILVCSIKKIQESSCYDFYPIYLTFYDLFQEIDLTQYVIQSITDRDDINNCLTVMMKAASPIHALHSYPDDIFDEEMILSRSNQLQVTVKSRGIVYDLGLFDTKGPVAINEIPAMHHLLDCQSYVETGVKLNKIKHKSPVENDDICYQLTQEIESNNTGSFYILRSSQFQHNEPGQDASEVERHSPFLGGYRSFCELDLIEMKRIEELINHNQVIKKIDLNTIYSTFEGQSIFTIFEGELRLYQQILQQLSHKEFQPREDYDGEDIESPHLRKLVQILTQKSSIDNSHLTDGIETTKARITSVLQRNQNEVHVRDSLLQIANMCQNFSIFDVISSQASIESYLSTSTPTIIELFNSCFIETKSTRSIRRLAWPANHAKTLTFFQSDCMVSIERCEGLIQALKPKKRIANYVKVQKFNMGWLFQDGKTFLNLVSVLNDSSRNTGIFDTEFVQNLLGEFWEKYQQKLFWHMFVPFNIYILSAISFMYVSLYRMSSPFHDPWYSQDWVLWTLGAITFVLWLQQLYLEFIQWKGLLSQARLDCKLSRIWQIGFFNLNDLFILTTLIILIVSNLIERHEIIRMNHVSILSAFVTFSLLVKFYEWLRIFEKPAFYIFLIAETAKDIRAFIVLFVAGLMMYGIPMTMLNFYRFYDSPVVDQLEYGWLFDSFMNQYYLALGEFHTDNFTDHPYTFLLLFFFIGATMFTQILMLNMIIAIMGDTFEKVTENKLSIYRKNKLELMQEYAGFLPKWNPEQFMFKVTVEEEKQDDIDSWDGSLNFIKRINDRHFADMKANFSSQMARLEQLEGKVNEFATRDVSKMIYASQAKTNARFDSIESKFLPKFDDLEKKLSNRAKVGERGNAAHNQLGRKSFKVGGLDDSMINKTSRKDGSRGRKTRNDKAHSQGILPEETSCSMSARTHSADKRHEQYQTTQQHDFYPQQQRPRKASESEDSVVVAPKTVQQPQVVEQVRELAQTVEKRVQSLGIEVQQSLQLNAALDFNVQQLSMKVGESIDANQQLDRKVEQLAEKVDSALATILARLDGPK